MEAGPATGFRGLRGILLINLAIWLALRQVDGVLGYLQSTGTGGYGANDLYAVSFAGLPEHVRDLLAVWERTRPVSHVAFAAYTALDVVFVWVYTVLLLLLFARMGAPDDAKSPIDRALGKAPWVVVLLACADLLENALRSAMVAFGFSPDWFVYVAWGATTVKWGALATVVLILVRAWSTVGLAAGPGRWTPESWWALRRLRVPAFFVAVVGLILVFDPTGQVRDSFRRWLDSPEQFGTSAAWTVGGVVLLGLATWTTARRAVLGDYNVASRPLAPLRWAGAALLLGAAAIKFGLHNLFGPAVAIGAVAAVELWWIVFGARHYEADRQEERKDDAKNRRAEAAGAPKDDRETEVRRVARALATMPLLALLLGLIAAWTAPPVVLLTLEYSQTRAVLSAAGALVALVLLAVLARFIPARLRAADDRSSSPPTGLEAGHIAVAAVCLLLCALAVVFPLEFPSLVGPVGMTAVIVALLIVLLGEGQRYSDTHAPSAGLTFVGFSRVPVLLVLLIALTVAALVDDGSYHSVRTNGEPPPARAGIPLQTAFDDWSSRNCADAGGPDRQVPMVFVASQGGGIRAAYWTASVLTDVLGPPAEGDRDGAPCPGTSPFDRVFAMGGASGGSVGMTSFYDRAGTDDEDWYRDVMGDTDFVAVPISWALLVDLPRSFVGLDLPDRQQRFEEVWEREDEALEKDFFKGQSKAGPVLMLSGTQVETGCRMNISPLRLTVPTDSTSQGECAVLRPTAALTSDVLDFLCEESIHRSTAALTSARFPYVSPSGQMTKCIGGRTIAVVDGGYAENTGAQPILNLWERLEPLVAAKNAMPDTPRIVPVFVEIDNHYSKAGKAGPGERTPQLFVPPLTAARSDALDDRGVEQLASAEFSTALPGAADTTCTLGSRPGQRFIRIAPTESPGVQAPLGWTLSRMSIRDLDRQRDEALDLAPAIALRNFVTQESIYCR